LIVPASPVITDRVIAVSKAGLALSHLLDIRDSTLPGTQLWDAAENALAGVDEVLGALYAPDHKQVV
jgi:hypothetical protein